MFLINLITMMHIGNSQALINREINRMDMMNETFVILITFLTVAFTDFV